MVGLPGISLFDGMFQGMERVLDLRSIQHTLTAGNISNADTPNYRAKEIPFEELLAEVMDRSLDGKRVDPEEMVQSTIEEKEPTPWALDGNSVDAEAEAMRMTTNTLMYNALSGGMSRRLAMLRFAASDGKS